MVACNYTFGHIFWAFFCTVQYLLFTFSEVRLVFVIYIEEICCRTTCNVDVGEQTFVRTRNLCLVNRRIGLRSSVGNFCFILASPSTLNYWECEERTSKAEKNLCLLLLLPPLKLLSYRAVLRPLLFSPPGKILLLKHFHDRLTPSTQDMITI